MKKIILVVAAASCFGFAISGVLAANQPDPLKAAMGLLHKSAPVLKAGEWVQDENGCVYSVKKKSGDRISRDPAVTTPEGKIVCNN